MRIGIFGTGGVGGYFGGRLAQAGEEVVFIARGEHLQVMRLEGLRVESIQGNFSIHPVQATDQPKEAGPVDMVLVAVKAWQVPQAAELMQPMVGDETGIVPLENGVDAPDQLAARLGARHVLGGLCRISAFVAGPGRIQHVGIEPFIAFGELDGGTSERCEGLRQAFERAGVNVQVPGDIQAAMWEKFIFIAALSGVGAVTRAPAGIVRSLPGTRRMLEQAIQEIIAVARSRGIRLPDNVLQNTLSAIDQLQPTVLASMQRDIAAGRPSELESQNGTAVRMGQEQGVPTPTHAFIYHSLLSQELRARGEIQF